MLAYNVTEVIFTDTSNLMKDVTLPNMSKNAPITPDLCTFTEQIRNENLQNLQSFP